MADVFISYARDDRATIEKLAVALEASGYSVWWDRHLESGAEFSADIERELGAADAVIVCWSQEGTKSRWVKDEANVAAEAGKLLAVTLDDGLPPIGYRQYHSVNFAGWKGDRAAPAFEDLARALASRAKTDSSPSMLASAPTVPPQVSASRAMPFLPVAIGVVAVLIAAIVWLTLRPGGETPDMSQADKASVASQAAGGGTDGTEVVRTASNPDNNIVAVLPFDNRSPREDDAYFADGMHDDLLTQLSKISALQVISRTSVLRFRDTQTPIPDIAEQLGAAVVMEGAVQRAGNRVRINVQLIDGTTDQHLWAETYDREMTAENVFDIQGEITRAIADAMEAVLSGDDVEAIDARPTQNVAAYNAYLRGKLLSAPDLSLTYDDYVNAIAALDEAIALDPEFAEAYAQKARAALSLYWLLVAGDEWRDRARATLNTAIALAPDSIEVQIAQGYYHYWGLLDYDAAMAIFRDVLARSPNNVDAILGTIFVNRRSGNYADAVEGFRRVLRLDPLDIQSHLDLVETARSIGNFDEAIAALATAKSIDPRNSAIAFYATSLYYMLGDADAAWAEFQKPVDNPDWRYYNNLLSAALLTRSPANVREALERWDPELREVPNSPLSYEILKADALYDVGERAEADTLLAEIVALQSGMDDPYPGGWTGNAQVSPVMVPGLLGDLQTVRAVADEFEANGARDKWSRAGFHTDIAKAFARAGDRDAAIDYLTRIVGYHGPWRVRSYRLEPSFDDLHDHPGWKALEREYEAWARENEQAR